MRAIRFTFSHKPKPTVMFDVSKLMRSAHADGHIPQFSGRETNLEEEPVRKRLGSGAAFAAAGSIL